MGGKPSPEAVQRWEKNNYKKILLRLRYDSDQDLLDYIDANKEELGTTEIFRVALREYIANHRN